MTADGYPQPIVAVTQVPMRSMLGDGSLPLTIAGLSLIIAMNVEVSISVCATKLSTSTYSRGMTRSQELCSRMKSGSTWLGDGKVIVLHFPFPYTQAHKEWPPVERLPIHLPDEQMGVYDPISQITITGFLLTRAGITTAVGWMYFVSPIAGEYYF